MKAVLVLALAFTGCANHEREEKLLASLQQKASMPNCDGTSVRIVERIPGGGADGSGLGLEVSMPEKCADRWIANLNQRQDFFRNFEHGGYLSGFPECGEEVVVLHRQGPAKVDVGLITNFGGHIRECYD